MWDAETAEHDVMTARSRSGHIITYAGCPIVWGSNLQTIIALLTTETKLLTLSLALHKLINLMELVRKVNLCGIHSFTTTPCVHCKVFEENSGALEIAIVSKIRP